MIDLVNKKKKTFKVEKLAFKLALTFIVISK